MRQKVLKIFEQYSGYQIMRQRPAGHDLARDIARWLPNLAIKTILDVGANAGQSAHYFASAFEEATIHSLEPGSGIFEKLVDSTRHIPRVVHHRVALGAHAEAQRLFVVKNLVSHLAQDGENLDGTTVHPVQVETLDAFCQRVGIQHVNLLKVDTEGNDLDVLRGGDDLFRRAAVDIVQVEAGLYPMNDRHVPLRVFQDWLEERGYFLFGFYEQTHEFNGEPQLRRADVAFISPRLREGRRRVSA